MLCNSRTPRPDKLLQRRLITLSYSLIALTIALISFLLYPDYRLLSVLCFILLTVICFILTFKTINAAEKAISYGGFANELMKNDFEILRIDNAKLEPVLQNDLAADFFRDAPIVSFLEQHLTNNTNNQMAFSRLKSALLNLTSDTVTLNLNIHHEDNTVFTPESYFEVSIRPIYLKKTDIFTGRFSIKAIKKYCYILWRLKDISARHNMEQIFQDERKSLHDFLDYLPVGLFTCRSDYYIEYCNHTFANLLGLNREDLVSHNLKDIIAHHSSPPPLQSHWSGNIYFSNSNNEKCEFFVTQESFRDDKDIKFHCVALNNIPNDTDLKQHLDKSLDEINWLFDNAPVGIGFIGTDGQILDCNANIALYFNATKDNLIHHNLTDFINQEDISLLMHLIEELQKDQEHNFSQELRFKVDGADKVASLYLQPMQSLHTNQQELKGFVFYLIDATQHKKLELQYAQAQKMQALGQMAGGVAHDFNNLLTAMIGFCDLLLQRHGVGDPSFTDLMQIKQNANRAAALVRQLLAFSRQQPLKPKLIDVTENFVELSQLLKRVLGEQITLKFNHSADLGYVRVDPVQFSQVFLNLAVNAKDAMNGRGTLTITTRIENLSQPYQFGADTIAPGEFVVIDVHDTGCGIPIENLNRIFEPFFSTKQNVVGSGTGLGLAMVYGIVRQTEGFIKVESIVGKGTTFSVHLPRFDKEPEQQESTETKEIITDKTGTPVLTVQERTTSPVGVNQKLIFGLNVSALDRHNTENSNTDSNVRILFVEDEDSVRTFALRALKKKGYDVIGCNSAENALEKLETDKNFNLLITDMVMPGMSGAELAGIAHEQIPDIKIILASGYSEELARKELPDANKFAFMAKPFSLGDLTKKVFDVLNEQ
ncbi:MAG: response regulator [Alphaproteobacteria bacterium]|nr:response regulator [Alphaproteobacteria bacterium]